MAFDVEFLFPESVEYAIRVLSELVILRGVVTAIKCNASAENLFRWIDNEPALLRDSARVDIQIANLASIGVFAIKWALNLPDVHPERNEAHAHVVRHLKVVGGLHREIRVRTRVCEVELDFVDVHGDAMARKSARWTTLIFERRRRSSAPPWSARPACSGATPNSAGTPNSAPTPNSETVTRMGCVDPRPPTGPGRGGDRKSVV